MPRSFIAVEANERVRNSLSQVQTNLEQTGADLKTVKSENVHLTLRFLGDVSETRLDLIKDAVSDATTLSPFKASVEGMGVFPKPSFIRVIWAGVGEGTEELKTLRKNVDQELSEIDFPPEDKDFTPHFTISRVKSGKAKDKLNSIVDDNSDKKWGTIEVDEIELKKSELTSEGPIYTTLEVFPLS